jgi:hypothetical protein
MARNIWKGRYELGKPVIAEWIYLLVTLILMAPSASGQDEELKKLQGQFSRYSRQLLQEKLYVHVDKDFYVAGEIVWFKIYAVEGSENRLMDLSKIAYVEIISGDQKPLLQAKIELRNGTGDGSFFLPQAIASGNYVLRAYTSWMKNFAPEYFFRQSITVVNTLKKTPVRQASLRSSYEVRFFPEGGNLVEGLPSTVGFKVNDQQGRGADFKGTLIDQNNVAVASFEPQAFGMGRFRFTPKPGDSYRAIIRLHDNDVVVGEFPNAYSTGYVMNLEEGDDHRIHVNVRSNAANGEGQFVYLLVHSRQQIKWASAGRIKEGKCLLSVDRDSLGEGISSFTIFNPQRQAVCERLYFRRPEPASIDAGTNQAVYGTRSKVTLNLLVYGQASIEKKPEMSVSVYLQDSLQTSAQNDILSYLWLSADIPGYIESPQYYFKDSSAAGRQAADNLMLTQGWRRFRWEDLLAGRPPELEYVPEYEGHIILARVTEKKTGKPADHVLAYVAAPGTKFQLGGSVSDKEGLLKFDLKNLYNTNAIILQTDQNDSSYRLDIVNPFSEKYAAGAVPGLNLDEEEAGTLLSHSVGTQVQNAFHSETLLKTQIQSSPDSTSFYGSPDHKYFLDEYTRFNTMEEVLREYVTDINVRKRQKKFQILVLNDAWRWFFEDQPLMLLDGVPIFDADKIVALDPLKVKKIEVVNRQYFLGPLINYGIISLYTYNGDLAGVQLDPNALVIEYEGLQSQREFYSPSYETPEMGSSRLPDFRNQLYWSPRVQLDKNGTKQVSFYTSDRTGNYIGVIQGLTQDGKAISRTFNFEVTR